MVSPSMSRNAEEGGALPNEFELDAVQEEDSMETRF